MVPYQKVIIGLQKYITEKTVDTNQRAITTTYVRFKVTTCLYLCPNKTARSLSTLITDIVNRDTPHKIAPAIKPAADM